MRLFLLLSPLLFLGNAAHSQTEEPKEFAFSFKTASKKSDGKTVTENTFVYSRLFPPSNEVVFDEHVSTAGGLDKSDGVTFLDKNGVELAKLTSDFKPDGKLKSQTISTKGQPQRTLNWFQTKAQSPDISVLGSIVQVRYTLENGFYHQRTVTVALPTQMLRLTTDYDTNGRRIHDSTTKKSGIMDIKYQYSPMGLTHWTARDSKEPVVQDAFISYMKSGELDELVFKQNDIIQNRMKSFYKADGTSTGQEIESYEDGILNMTAITDLTSKTITKDEYDLSGNHIVERTGYAIGEKEKTLSYTEQWENGKVVQRTDYDLGGKKTSVTKYKADGTIESKETFNSSVSTVK